LTALHAVEDDKGVRAGPLIACGVLCVAGCHLVFPYRSTPGAAADHGPAADAGPGDLVQTERGIPDAPVADAAGPDAADTDGPGPDGATPKPDVMAEDKGTPPDTGPKSDGQGGPCSDWTTWTQSYCGGNGCTYSCTGGGHTYKLSCTVPMVAPGSALCDCQIDNGLIEPCGPSVPKISPCEYPCTWYLAKGCCVP
jgi:hypothetical protein